MKGLKTASSCEDRFFSKSRNGSITKTDTAISGLFYRAPNLALETFFKNFKDMINFLQKCMLYKWRSWDISLKSTGCSGNNYKSNCILCFK